MWLGVGCLSFLTCTLLEKGMIIAVVSWAWRCVRKRKKADWISQFAVVCRSACKTLATVSSCASVLKRRGNSSSLQSSYARFSRLCVSVWYKNSKTCVRESNASALVRLFGQKCKFWNLILKFNLVRILNNHKINFIQGLLALAKSFKMIINVDCDVG